LGRRAHRRRDIPLLLTIRGTVADRAERSKRQDGPCPGPEVLGRDAGRDGSEIVVDIVRRDVVGFAVVADVLEELLPGQLATAANDRRQAPISEANLVLPAGLAAEPEPDRCPLDLRVAV